MRSRVRNATTPPERGFQLIGASGFEPGTSSPPDCFSRVAGNVLTWREVAWLLAFRPLSTWITALFASFGFRAFVTVV
jgi:hypothetical protein